MYEGVNGFWICNPVGQFVISPFDSSIIIKHTQYITIKVYDALGKEVMTLVNEKLSAGSYEAEFNGSNLSSGMYFYKLSAENYSSVKRMILLK